jgi:hypothetical protein
MKTIAPKNAFKLFLFLLILFSAKAFSFTILPNAESSRGSGSRFSTERKAKTISKKPSTSFAAAHKGKALQSRNYKRFKK